MKGILAALFERLRKRIPRRTRDLLYHMGMTFTYVTLIGTASNIPVLAAGYIITLPHLFEFILGYYLEFDNQKLWLIYLGVSQIFCILGCGGLSALLGSGAARYRFWYGGHLNIDRPDTPVMLWGLGIGTALHTALCLLVTRVNMAYLFFAGPVQYIARFLAHGDRSLFVDVAFHFPRSITIAAILIYSGLAFISAAFGYLIGYRRQLILRREDEAERLRGEAPEKTWSDEDREQLPYAYRDKDDP